MIDAKLFQLLNSTLSNPLFDRFFPWWTNVQRTDEFLYFIGPLIIAALFYFARFRGLFIFGAACLLTWLVDVCTSQLIKPIFLRPRPFDAGIDVILRIPRPGSSSFPSGHAMDAFCLATIMAFAFPRARVYFYVLAFLTAYSRVYCGVHYPGDVVGGAVIGVIVGWPLARLVHMTARKAFK